MCDNVRYNSVITLKERLPMHENYTEEIKFETAEEQIEVGPKEATINFLKQFARAYTFTGINQSGLEGFVVN